MVNLRIEAYEDEPEWVIEKVIDETAIEKLWQKYQNRKDLSK